MIREAEGEAEAILKVQQANADGIRLLKEAEADEAVLKIKSLEAFEKVADGQGKYHSASRRVTGNRKPCSNMEDSRQTDRKQVGSRKSAGKKSGWTG